MIESCIYVESDMDGPEFCDTSYVKARKSHTCIECRRTIKKGELYEYTAGKWDGEFDTMKTCNDCLSVRSIFFNNNWGFGQVWESIFEALQGQDLPLSQLDGLTVVARDRVIECIDEEDE